MMILGALLWTLPACSGSEDGGGDEGDNGGAEESTDNGSGEAGGEGGEEAGSGESNG